MRTGLTIAELQRQVRQLNDAKGFEITLEQRLAYLMTEVGEVLELSRTEGADVEATVEALGMEIYDVVWNLLDLADMAGVDLEEAFGKKARLNESREW